MVILPNYLGGISRRYLTGEFAKTFESQAADAQKKFSIPTDLFEKLVYGTSLDLEIPQASSDAPAILCTTFEDLKQAYGFVLYRTTLKGGNSGTLKIKDLRDYGLVFVNGKRVAILDRRLKQDSTDITLPAGNVTLEILVENLGRINFGPYLLKNRKGIDGQVLFNGKAIHQWQQFKLPHEQQPVIKASAVAADAPVLKEGSFTLSSKGDTYLDMSKWGKGVVWINGHHLGRYWKVGPQQTLYVPAEWLKTGRNKITVLELIKPAETQVQGLDHPILDVLQ